MPRVDIVVEANADAAGAALLAEALSGAGWCDVRMITLRSDRLARTSPERPQRPHGRLQYASLEVEVETPGARIATVMRGYEDLAVQNRPSWTMVAGSGAASMAVTIAAKKLGLQVARLGAGVRVAQGSAAVCHASAIDALCDLLLAPSPVAVAALAAEGSSRALIVSIAMPSTGLISIATAQSIANALRQRIAGPTG